MDVDVSDSGSRQWVPSMPMSRQQDTSFSLAWLLRAPTAATSLSETMEVSNNWPGTVSQTEILNYMEQIPSSLVCLEAQKGDPLLPLLFILLFEPLAITIRKRMQELREYRPVGENIFMWGWYSLPGFWSSILYPSSSWYNWNILRFPAIKSSGINQRLCQYAIQLWLGVANFSGLLYYI